MKKVGKNASLPAAPKVKTPRKPLNTTTEMIMRAMDGGIDVKQAVAMATGNLTPRPETLSRIRTKYQRKWSLVTPQADKIAGRTIKALADGKEINGIKPDAKTCLTAASMIKDRTEPVKRQESLITNNYIQINLDSGSRSEHQFIDVTPQDIDINNDNNQCKMSDSDADTD